VRECLGSRKEARERRLTDRDCPLRLHPYEWPRDEKKGGQRVSSLGKVEKSESLIARIAWAKKSGADTADQTDGIPWKEKKRKVVGRGE